MTQIKTKAKKKAAKAKPKSGRSNGSRLSVVPDVAPVTGLPVGDVPVTPSAPVIPVAVKTKPKPRAVKAKSAKASVKAGPVKPGPVKAVKAVKRAPNRKTRWERRRSASGVVHAADPMGDFTLCGRELQQWEVTPRMAVSCRRCVSRMR